VHFFLILYIYYGKRCNFALNLYKKEMATIEKISGNLPYDIKSATSIFEYSKGLLGKTLRDYMWEGYETKKGKGGL
jgi:hypothetical protein